MIVIAGSFRLDDGVTDEVMAACKSVMQATHQEEGCHEYIFYPDPLDSNVLRVFEMWENDQALTNHFGTCLLYTSPSPRDISGSRMPSSA